MNKKRLLDLQEDWKMSREPVLTKKDCVKGAIRWSLMAVTTFNYDTSWLRQLYSVSGLFCGRSILMTTIMLRH